MVKRKNESYKEWYTRQTEETKKKRYNSSKAWLGENPKKRAKYNETHKQAFRGYQGTYKGKRFTYKVKLPKGAVRHHVVYRDEDPDYGLIFCTPAYHLNLHRNPINGQNGGTIK